MHCYRTKKLHCTLRKKKHRINVSKGVSQNLQNSPQARPLTASISKSRHGKCNCTIFESTALS